MSKYVRLRLRFKVVMGVHVLAALARMKVLVEDGEPYLQYSPPRTGRALCQLHLNGSFFIVTNDGLGWLDSTEVKRGGWIREVEVESLHFSGLPRNCSCRFQWVRVSN